jgi:SAM-dependent methyltransferase
MTDIQRPPGLESAVLESGWHEEQDASVDERLAIGERSLAGSSAVFRVWYWSATAIFNNAHFVQLRALKRSDERFRLLDLGCGTGELTRELGAAFPRAAIVGIDSNPQSVAQAQAALPTTSNVSYVDGLFEDAGSLGSFDVVVCSEVLEHVERPVDLLEAAYAVLNSGGYLSFSTPSGWMWRRPGVFTLLELLGSPVDPSLRGQRRPRAAVRRMRDACRWYSRVRLRPERNWTEALSYHPAIQPRVIRGMLERAGFEVALRTSSLWHLDARFSLVYRRLRASEQSRPVAAGNKFFHLLMLLEALLNLVPLLRIFESRQIVLARKPA